MQLLNHRRLLSIVIGALGIIWSLVAFAVSDWFVPALPYSGGAVFVLFAAALSVLYLTVFRCSPGRQAVEAAALPVYFTILYVIASMVLNTVLVLNGLGGFNKILLICNAVLAAAYSLVILFAEKDNQRLSEQLSRTEQKLSGPVDISAKLGRILGIVEDGEIRAQVLKLKEAVDLSTNITTGATVESERLMERQIDELMELVARRAESSAIQDKLREAERTWKIRSSDATLRR